MTKKAPPGLPPRREWMKFVNDNGVVRLPPLELMDAEGDISDEMQRDGVSFDVALWHWWQRRLQSVKPLTPHVCPHCGAEFLNWRNARNRKYCGLPCKQATQNRRWYYGDPDRRARRIQQIVEQHRAAAKKRRKRVKLRRKL